MKKRIYALSVLFICILFSAGCSSSVPELSNEQNNQIAEYIAASLLKYDANYDAVLEYDESVLDITPTPVPTEEPEPSQEPQGSGESVNQQPEEGTGAAAATASAVSVIAEDFSSVLGGGKYVVAAKGMEVMKHYDDPYTDVDAMEGMKLLVVTFQIKNTSNSTIHVNMLDSDSPVVFTASVAGSAVKPLYTFVSNDLRYYSGKIPAGKSRSAVLLFEVSKDVDVSDVTVIAEGGDKQAAVAVP